MKTKLLFICCLTSFVVACGGGEKKEADCDILTIDAYDNKYDDNGRLERVVITRTTYYGVIKEPGVNIFERLYSYKNDHEYTVEEISAIDSTKEITNYSENSKETVRIKNGIDTVDYSLQQYNNQNNPSYIKEKHKHGSILIDDNYEEYYYYDATGRKAKKRLIDHRIGSTVDTWYFNDISFTEALWKMPPLKHPTEIVCFATHRVRDTIIERRYVNGKLANIYKTFRDGKKDVDASYDDSGGLNYVEEKFQDNGFDIRVTKSIEFSSIDSIFCQNERVIRSVAIDLDKRITTSEYDEKGNILREETKMWFLDKKPKHSF